MLEMRMPNEDNYSFEIAGGPMSNKAYFVNMTRPEIATSPSSSVQTVKIGTIEPTETTVAWAVRGLQKCIMDEKNIPKPEDKPDSISTVWVHTILDYANRNLGNFLQLEKDWERKIKKHSKEVEKKVKSARRNGLL